MPWRDIAEVRIVHARGQRMLGIMPADLDRYLARLPRAQRWLARANVGLGFAPISVPENALVFPCGSS